MNRAQRTLVVVSMLAIVGMVAVPPWRQEQGTSINRPIGYFPIWSGPKLSDFEAARYEARLRQLEAENPTFRRSPGPYAFVKVDVVRLSLQILGVMVFCGSALAVLRK